MEEKTSVEQIQVVEFSAQVASRITFSAERQPQQLMHTYEKLCIVIKRYKATVTPWIEIRNIGAYLKWTEKKTRILKSNRCL